MGLLRREKELEMGADFGNSTLKFYTSFKTPEGKTIIKKDCVKALSSLSSIDTGAAVTLKGKPGVHFGVGDPLVALDKTKRRYIEESLLLGIALLFGNDANDSLIRICVGLPLTDYTSEPRKQAFAERLAEISTLKGEVTLNGETIFLNVTILTTVYAEGLAAFYYYQPILDKTKRWLIWDTGYQTTDVVGLVYSNNKWVIDGNKGEPAGLREMYDIIGKAFCDDNNLPIFPTHDIESYINNTPLIETKKGERDIKDWTKNATSFIQGIYDKLELVFPDIEARRIKLVGGGAWIINKHLDVHNKYIDNDLETLLYANVAGYYLRVCDMKRFGKI